MINTNENQDSFVLDLNEVAFTLHNILTWNLYNKLCLSRITYSNLDQTIGIVAKYIDSNEKGTCYFDTKYEEGKFTRNFDSRLNVIGHTPLTPELVRIGLENINFPGRKQKITIIPLHDTLRDKQIVKLAGLEKFCPKKVSRADITKQQLMSVASFPIVASDLVDLNGVAINESLWPVIPETGADILEYLNGNAGGFSLLLETILENIYARVNNLEFQTPTENLLVVGDRVYCFNTLDLIEE